LDAQSANRWVISEELTCVSLLALMPACAIFLLVLPRSVEPTNFPGLRLDSKEVTRVLDRDRSLESRDGSALERELWKLFLEQGAAERGLTEPPSAFVRRRDQIRRTLVGIQEAPGDKSIEALQARAARHLELALGLSMSRKNAEQVLGSFPNFLERYQLAREGILLAPHFVIRTLYKSRWNLIHDLPATYAFSRVERLAYYGWLTLHTDSAALSLRQEALYEYERLGGSRVAEAKGAFYFQQGQYERATFFLERAAKQHPTLRLRNYALAAAFKRDHSGHLLEQF
jgi:hypothetical protein